MAAIRLQIACDWLQIDCKTTALRLQLQLKCSHVAAMGLQYLQNDFSDVIAWLHCGWNICKMTSMTSLNGCIVAAKSANWLQLLQWSKFAAISQRYCSDIAAICSDFAAILQPNCSFAAAQQDAAKLHTLQLIAVVDLANLQVDCKLEQKVGSRNW